MLALAFPIYFYCNTISNDDKQIIKCKIVLNSDKFDINSLNY